ncbi:procyclic acidic repetitive family protein [Rhodoblastus sp. 17X3]|uniref:procyclic acidic repetitive family protein n=1 Tax=Rhodoblastus sp. 17X3 TaxID=3047026 RepID=UPI0024B64757|nr:procyclic acidic repetitive family protein [Rhodoblastus sp. 17X3]MDI9848543.1 procyclic acidic repetitive family protein [Rhodoblastus sp. 17X3]
MADYYPLLAKAISGLKDSTPEARTAIYDRARKALLGQLRGMQPPAPDHAIEREANALEEAIARLELEQAVAAPPPEAEPPLAFEATPQPEAELKPEPAPEDEPRIEPESEAEPGPSAEGEERPDEPPPIAKFPDEAGLADEDDALPREALRPAAPKPKLNQAGGLRRFAIIAGALAAVVALVGVAAWKLRDRPEDLAKLAPAPEATEQKSGGKIGQRVGEDAGSAPRPAPAAPPAGAASNIPIAYRAAILLQAPSEPGGVKTYVGTVVWRRDAANRGPNQQLSSAIRAEIDIPEAGLKSSLTIEKNYDAALSASHTLTVRFDPAADSTVGSVRAINVPEMRRDDAPRGAALQGMQVDIAPNVFLVGLYSSAEAQNVDMIRNLNWFDIPMNLTNGKIAKVTFEKGVGGSQIVNDVFNEWKTQP